MSSSRYIEIDSTYRNRNQWPLPGQFEVPIAQSGRKNAQNALDPVSLATPFVNAIWKSNNFNANTNNATVSTTVTSIAPGIGASGDNKNIIQVTAGSNQLQTLDNYYQGAIAEDTTSTLGAGRIESYKYLGNNRAQLTVASMTSVSAGDTILIQDPTDISDLTNPYFFVPAGREGMNAYPNCILYNDTRNNYANIISYDMNTRLLKTEDITGLGWAITDFYSIRKQPPSEIGTINNNTPSATNLSFPLTSSPIQNIYQSGFVRITSGTASGETRRITRYETFSGRALGGSLNTIQLPLTASKIVGYYNNMFIQITSGGASGDVRQVLSYTPASNGVNATITVSSNFSSAISTNDSFSFRNATTLPFSSPISFGTTFEILPFAYDNMNPFVYSGSQVSQQQEVCYEIELHNLILPNKTLNVGVGARIAFYPYVYVELSNISGANAGMKDAIYTNNPNAKNMIFRVAIDDVPNPVISSFVKVDGDGTVQTLKFKPNDNLKFSVHLPNGEIYQTEEEEFYGPNQPNPEIQISALFSIKRL